MSFTGLVLPHRVELCVRALALYESLELSSLLMISILPFKLIQDKARPQNRRGQGGYVIHSSYIIIIT